MLNKESIAKIFWLSIVIIEAILFFGLAVLIVQFEHDYKKFCLPMYNNTQSYPININPSAIIKNTT